MAIITVTRSLTWDVLDALIVTRSASWDTLQTVTVTRAANWVVDPLWDEGESCPVVPGSDVVFRRIKVDYNYIGGARISWELDRHFLETPSAFQLQTSHAGVESADDWTSVGAPQTNVFYLTDPDKRMYGKTPTLHYRVQLTTTTPNTYNSPAASVLGKLDEHGFLIVREVFRKEQLRHRLFGSVPGLLLKARRYGTTAAAVDELTKLITNSDSTDSFGREFVSGFYPSVDCAYCDITPEESREFRNLEGTGTEKQLVVRGRFMGFPPLIQGDLWVNRDSGERYMVHSVKEMMTWRSVPVAQLAELRLIPFSSVLYQVPVS